MMYVQIENGLVVNRAVFDATMPPDWPDYDQWVQNNEAQIGWSYADGAFTAPPDPPLPILAPPAPQIDTVLLLDHENRLRTIEGSAPLKMEEFLVRLKR